MEVRSGAHVLFLALALLTAGCVAHETRDTATPQRIVAVAPGIVETLFALDLGSRVVGVGNYAHWPPEVEALPRIGGLYDPRYETVASLEPDLAILVPSEAELRGALERLGVEVMIVPHETLADLETAIHEISKRAGVPERGRLLVASLGRDLEPRAQQLASGVLLSVARQPGRGGEIYAAGPNTFLGELLTKLGASNAVAPAAPVSPAAPATAASDTQLYPRLGFEEAVARAPEVVVELQPETVSLGDRLAWERDWRTVAGDGAPCVVIVDGSHTLLPGPRVTEVYRDLERALVSCAVDGAG